MAEEVTISKNNIVRLANERFGTKAVLLHYITAAKQAGERAKAAASIPNAVTMGMEIAIMNESLLILSNLLNDDKTAVDQQK